ncbi:MAG: PAS domain S-box protein [Methanoregula sp.]|jgi:PAS domain S-box-containing protein
MKHSRDEISRIVTLLKDNPKGLTIREISQSLDLNRISAARYLESLLFSGQAEMRRFGPAKVYSLAFRIPISRILNLFSWPVIIIDREFFIRDVNDRALELCNVPRENLVGHHIRYSRFCMGLYEEISGILIQVFEGNSYTEEKNMTLNDRNYSFLMKLEPVADSNGQTCVALIFEDISVIRQYQKNLDELVKKRTLELKDTIETLRSEIEDKRQILGYLQTSQKKYRDLVEDMPACICTFEPDGTITFVNEGFCRLFLRDAQELVGTSIQVCIPSEAIRESLALLEQKTPEIQSHTSIQPVIIRDNVTVWQQWITRAFFDKHGKITEYQTIGIDITGRIRALQDLKNLKERFEQILRGSPIPQLVIDADHRIVLWNAALENFFGVPSDSMIGTISRDNLFEGRKRQFLADLVADENLTGIGECFPGISRTTKPLLDIWEGPVLSDILEESGSWFYLTASAIRDQSGKISQVVETIQNLKSLRMQSVSRNRPYKSHPSADGKSSPD